MNKNIHMTQNRQCTR